MNAYIQNLYQTISTPPLIKLIVPSLVLLFSFQPGDGTGKQDPPVIQKKMNVEGPFQNVRIYGDVSTILTNDPSGAMVMEGKEKDVNKIKYHVQDNELVIDARRKNYFNKLVIYLPAVTLQSMQVNGDGDISSTGMIQSDELHITLNGAVDVKIKTTGKVNIDAPGDLELKWKSPVKKTK